MSNTGRHFYNNTTQTKLGLIILQTSTHAVCQDRYYSSSYSSTKSPSPLESCNDFTAANELTKNANEKMAIYVKTVTGIKYVAEVDTVESLKSRLEDMEGTPRDQQRLFFAGTELKDCHTLSYYSIQSESTVHLVDKSRMKMRIFVKSITGRTYEVEVKPIDTVGNLKSKIENMDGPPKDQQKLIYDQMELKDSRTLLYYSIEHESIVHLVMVRGIGMYIFVKNIIDKAYVMKVKPEDTIENIKSKIEYMEGPPPEHQILVFDQKQLEDHHTLSYYNIQHKSTVHLVLRLRDPRTDL